MLRGIAPEFLIVFYKNSYNIYDLSIEMDFFCLHISKWYEYLLGILKIENPDLKYDTILTSKEERKVLKLIEKCNAEHRLALNPFAASRHRSFSYCRLKELIDIIEDEIDCCVFVVCRKKMRKKYLEIIAKSLYECSNIDKSVIRVFNDCRLNLMITI